MDELLQRLLEAEVLSEDTKKELETAFSTKLNEAIIMAKTNAAADVRTELTEQWIQERDTLIEAVDAQVAELLEAEMTELKEDIDRFRDLEAEYAERLVEAKASMTDELKSDLAELIEQLDTFLEMRIAAEVDELRESIEEARKNEFGRKVFEAFAAEYVSSYADENSIEGTLRETEERLNDTVVALEEAERKISTMVRKDKMSKVLSPLSGRSREVMEAILKSVPTEQLDEGYKTFIGRVLKETAEQASEKETPVLAEGAETGEKEVDLSAAVVITGDTKTTVTESAEPQMSEEARARLKRLAGL